MSAISAVLIAGGATLVGVLLCAAGGDELTRTFSVLYLGGCIVAALMVRYRGLFTAVVQPPLILFIAVPVAYQFMSDDSGVSPKDIALNAAIPLVNRFPLMLFTTLVTLIIGGYRVYLKRSGPVVASERRSKEPRTATQPQTSPATPARDTTRAESTSRPETPSRQRTEPAGTQRQRQDPPTQRQQQAAPTQRRRQDAPAPRPRRTEPEGNPRQETPPRQRQDAPTQRQPRTPTGQQARTPQQRAQRPAPTSTVRMPTARSASDVPEHPMPQVRYRDQ
ncbi:DUF6542 domain-containing protein [Aldersonia kunmingensis]|uniref:DUF6542 domain-containing protein n=1 Tax=Aldersonia kunmingensis TaxID=408066 RepID=UPI000AD801BF|nr:DUF6542 domain-containing protein [Aldersonia kunmingensis]